MLKPDEMNYMHTSCSEYASVNTKQSVKLKRFILSNKQYFGFKEKGKI